MYGSIWRSDEYINIVKDVYPKNKVIICDGEDFLNIRSDLSNIGVLFKRELRSSKALPISFAIPSEKIVKKPLTNQNQCVILRYTSFSEKENRQCLQQQS